MATCAAQFTAGEVVAEGGQALAQVRHRKPGGKVRSRQRIAANGEGGHQRISYDSQGRATFEDHHGLNSNAAGTFTTVHQQLWDRERVGDADGTRALIGVLLLHRTMSADAVTAGIPATIVAGTYDSDLVAVRARMSSPHNITSQSEPVPSPPPTPPPPPNMGRRVRYR